MRRAVTSCFVGLLLVFVLAGSAQGQGTPYPRVNLIGVKNHEDVWFSATLESYSSVPTCTLEGTVSVLHNDRPKVKLLPDQLTVACVGPNSLTPGVRGITLEASGSIVFIELTAVKGGLDYRGEGGFVEEELVACGSRAASPENREWEWASEDGSLQALEYVQNYVCGPGRRTLRAGTVESRAEFSALGSREPLRFQIQPPSA